MLIDSGAVKWNPKVMGKTVEQWLIEEYEEFQGNPVKARTIEEGQAYQKGKEAHRCLCNGDKPKFDYLVYQ